MVGRRCHYLMSLSYLFQSELLAHFRSNVHDILANVGRHFACEDECIAAEFAYSLDGTDHLLLHGCKEGLLLTLDILLCVLTELLILI